MAVGDLVQRVEELLGRGHALFGGLGSGGGVTWDSGEGLPDAVIKLHATRGRMFGQHGGLAAHYRAFVGEAGHDLDAAAGIDMGLGRRLHAAGRASGAGRVRSAAAVDGVRTDVAALTPASNTPAGQRVLIAALRARLVQQQRAVVACKERDARIAAVLRGLRYGGAGASLRRTSLGGNGPGVAAISGFGGQRMAARLTNRSGRSPMCAGSSSAPAVLGATVGVPLGALTPDSGPREVASAIIHEAHRRGYSPAQTTAILADALQESNLNPRAQSPNKLWYSIFQQDSSYPGRHNPNLAIAEFFNRLDRHGGPASPDIWKSIFWLQQRPGEPSAEAAFAHGRQAYLQEIQRQSHRAAAIYRDIAGG